MAGRADTSLPGCVFKMLIMLMTLSFEVRKPVCGTKAHAQLQL
jgi:hypothetical protein